jgi:hypothetical protein
MKNKLIKTFGLDKQHSQDFKLCFYTDTYKTLRIILILYAVDKSTAVGLLVAYLLKSN